MEASVFFLIIQQTPNELTIMNTFKPNNDDSDVEHASLDHMMEKQEDEAHDEEMNNQANSSRMIEMGFGSDYTPSFLR